MEIFENRQLPSECEIVGQAIVAPDRGLIDFPDFLQNGSNVV
jgi:hypothetical protein